MFCYCTIIQQYISISVHITYAFITVGHCKVTNGDHQHCTRHCSSHTSAQNKYIMQDNCICMCLSKVQLMSKSIHLHAEE